MVLRDGGVVEVRPLEPGDRPRIALAVEQLSERSRYLRFASAKPRLSESELDRLLDVDHHASEALVAVDPATGCVVAVVRYAAISGEPGVADVAATVADAWQGRGLGGALLARLLERAVDEGVAAVHADVLAVNARSIALLRRAGFRARPGGGVLLEFERSLLGAE